MTTPRTGFLNKQCMGIEGDS